MSKKQTMVSAKTQELTDYYNVHRNQMALGKWAGEIAIPAFKLIKEKRFTTKLPMEIRLDVVKDIAKEALEALPDVNLVEDFIKNEK